MEGTICCDRSSNRSDVCMMKGDVRMQSTCSSIFLYGSSDKNNFTNNFIPNIAEEDEQEDHEQVLNHEKIRPYTRKWETSTMNNINELNLIAKEGNPELNHHHCDVQHDVPAVFFSTGGYTGNLFHEFNDGLVPLYITSQHFNKKVVFVILEYHNWWTMKYGDVLSQLSYYPPIDFYGDVKTHCFPEAIVGLRIHGDLSVDSSLMEGNKSIIDFRNLLDRAYWPRIRGLIQDEEREAQNMQKENHFVPLESETLLNLREKMVEDQMDKPKLAILSRNGSREITNENLLVQMAEEIGFQVEVLSPNPRSELAKIYRALNSSDVLVGVHGAALTHFLFMKPGCVFIQVIPLGSEWAAETYFGEPARKLGLNYIGYRILARESSLYDKYDENDPILRDPTSVNKKGWEYTKSIYLDGQNVRLDLRRFQKHLDHVYHYSVSRIKRKLYLQSQ
ncbi:xylan glycosyltransferase MUCI21 [Ziziphus jujuba]|uniref:Xylan glycosyltransferase MUCI21 n=1 Tax=Ziziphus jujuba TaxID=326968 RepID=A0ABM3I6K3_ZIZJJ|nr:xylan glycosyltransferase MUCI21 [Ziziphus jujuba]